MPKVSLRMAPVSRESVFVVQTNTARKSYRSGRGRADNHAKQMLLTERMESRPFASLAIDRLGEPLPGWLLSWSGPVEW